MGGGGGMLRVSVMILLVARLFARTVMLHIIDRNIDSSGWSWRKSCDCKREGVQTTMTLRSAKKSSTPDIQSDVVILCRYKWMNAWGCYWMEQ